MVKQNNLFEQNDKGTSALEGTDNHNAIEAVPENEWVLSDTIQPVTTHKESLFKNILKGAGIGSLVLGGGLVSVALFILYFLFVALVGLSIIWLAVSLFYQGSIIWGVVVLFIGAPIAVGLASYLFPFLLVTLIIALTIWGVIYLLGFEVSFDDVWDGIWLIIVVLILGSTAFLGAVSFVKALKKRELVAFFKKSWFYFLIFFFMLWLFFI